MSLDRVLKSRLVPVAVIENEDDAVPLAEALLAAGQSIIEVTLRTPNALRGVESICKNCPDMDVGVGTLLDAALVPKVIHSGAKFAVSPGLSDSVVKACSKHQLDLFPGVITPSEVERARELGFSCLKFFPAEASGGATMLKALAGPYGHTGISFIPTGGIGPGNVREYLNLDCVAAVGGSWFVPAALLRQKKFDEIARLTSEAVGIAAEQEF